MSKREPTEPHREVYRSQNVIISTNIPGFKWPTQAEKIAGLLEAGIIDQAEAERLRAKCGIDP